MVGRGETDSTRENSICAGVGDIPVIAAPSGLIGKFAPNYAPISLLSPLVPLLMVAPPLLQPYF